jgi:sodium transport system ATP-binding protein
MIEIDNLVKIFPRPRGGAFRAVDGLSLSVRAGECLGLLGPNGAGKTTTLRVLCTLLKPTSGWARVAGFDVVKRAGEVRHRIGFLSANTGVYDRMTAREMVEYYGLLHGLERSALDRRIEELFTALQMHDFADTRGGRLSTGMRQKVSIARALVHDPPVLIFDEPTAGLDVLVARSVLNALAGLRKLGKCILFSTHIMSEVERLCDRVAVVRHGRMLACGTLDDLRRDHGTDDVEEIFFRLMDAAGDKVDP